MTDKSNKGNRWTAPPRTHEVGRGQFAREQDRGRERTASARATSDRDQRLRDQMLREAIRTASSPSLEPAGRFAGPAVRRAGGGVWALGALVLIVVYLVARHGADVLPAKRWSWPAPATPSAHVDPASVAGAAATSVLAADVPKPAAASFTATAATAAAAVPVFERFGLRRFELMPGDALELVVAWQPSDGIRRPGRMDAFVVTRDAARHRTPVIQGWAVFPGASIVPLALPPGIAPGKYELETVWTVGGEAREERANFTLADRSAALPMAVRAPQPSQTALIAAAPGAPAADPPSTLEPPAAPAPAAPLAVLAPAAPAPALRPPRAMASDPLYTGG